MSGIFISYRKGPHSVTVGALRDRLEHHFGRDQVFIDHQMAPGTRYPDELKEQLRDSDVLVAVIHDGWTDEFARPRHKDWVLFEIATALKNDKTVIPVMLEKADPPQYHQLPSDIAKLSLLQFVRVSGVSFSKEIEHLMRLLERHVAPAHIPPPKRAVATTSKRVGRRIIAWAIGLFLITPILAFDPSILFFDIVPWWRLFAFPAFASTVLLAIFSILSITLFPVFKRLARRWDDAGTMSLREATKRRWILLALGVLPFVYALFKVPMEDGAWQEWEVWLIIVAVIILLYFVHRTWRQHDADDHAWPPPVTTEPVRFRWAAHRLHEELTTNPDWRRPRSRAIQREAVSVYLSLAEVRRELRTRATMSLTRWIRAGHSSEITACLGWLASIVALDAAALALLTSLDSATLGAYQYIALTVAAALVFTAAKTVAEFYSDRREVTRRIDELTDWQTRLGPLVFCR